MAQSAESAITWAVLSIRSMVSMSAVRSKTRSISTASWLSPTRQGTHLPQVCAWHSRRKFRDMSTGQSPGWLDRILRSISMYNPLSTVWAFPGFSMESRLKFIPPSKSKGQHAPAFSLPSGSSHPNGTVNHKNCTLYFSKRKGLSGHRHSSFFHKPFPVYMCVFQHLPLLLP